MLKTDDNDTKVDNATAAVEEATPSMRQYHEIKAQYPNEILFFQMGDFYEMFFDDALKASAILDIALTRRGRHNGEPIPMCGVPVATADLYLEKFMRADVRVAICSQLETPEEAKKRGYKAVIRREVVRIVTPGTITEDNILKSGESNFICAISLERAGTQQAQVSLAYADITTGIMRFTTCQAAQIKSELARINPKEILLSNKLEANGDIKNQLGDFYARLAFVPARTFSAAKAAAAIGGFYGVSTPQGLGLTIEAEITAVGALLDYIQLTQVSARPRLDIPAREDNTGRMQIDAATRASLELTRNMRGEKKGSLLAEIDRTLSAPGTRLLASQLSSPLAEAGAINERLDAVEFFARHHDFQKNLRASLKNFPDLERLTGRVCLDRANPRDLGAVRTCMESIRLVREIFIHKQNLPARITQALEALEGLEELKAKLKNALRDELALSVRDGDIVREGYLAALDEFRVLKEEGRRLIAALQLKYQQQSGINTLKIKHNNMLGYFIEITAGNSGKALPEFMHRQTMSGAMRYTTIELKELEGKIESAGVKALELECAVFTEICAEIKSLAHKLALAASGIARLDAFSALAEVAADSGYIRPIVDNSDEFTIKQGRHPVVENSMRGASGGRFRPNDCNLGSERYVHLVTGPNMGGKSTYLRQNAIITVLAQAGSFVPAEYAHIGVVDKLFSRVGASDDLASGRSTFMVEMVETAAILNQATEKSLLILDEIGRGTSTFDGLSIAWAVLEHIHNTLKCRALFATHYHELTQLTNTCPNLECHTAKVKEWKGGIVLLHEIGAGMADRSYGLHVATLAGLPKQVVTRAGEILQKLEADKPLIQMQPIMSLPLFSYQKAAEPQEPPAMQQLKSLDPDSLSPKEALEALYELKKLLI